MFKLVKKCLIGMGMLVLFVGMGGMSIASAQSIEDTDDMVYLFHQLINNPNGAVVFAQNNLNPHKQDSDQRFFNETYYSGEYRGFEVSMKIKNKSNENKSNENKIDSISDVYVRNADVSQFDAIVEKLQAKYGRGQYTSAPQLGIEMVAWQYGNYNGINASKHKNSISISLAGGPIYIR